MTNDGSMPRGARSATTPLEKAVEVLIRDANAMGWDQPSKFYTIIGPMEDPSFEKLVDLPLEHHPAEFLQFVHTTSTMVGVDALPKTAIGLVLMNEGWRHLTLDEVEALDPASVNLLRETAKQNGLEGDDFKKAFYKMQMRARPSDMGEQFRHEIRAVTAVDRDGNFTSVMYDRVDDTLEFSGDKVEVGGRIPEAMGRFVQGQAPEPPDPISTSSKWETPALDELLKGGK